MAKKIKQNGKVAFRYRLVGFERKSITKTLGVGALESDFQRWFEDRHKNSLLVFDHQRLTITNQSF